MRLGRQHEGSAPSVVFAKRLRVIREDRGKSRPQLARELTDAGRPMSKLALLRIENGDRKLSLDEALALAQILYVAPAHLLTPTEGELVWLTNGVGLEGQELRDFLLTGQPVQAWPETPIEEDVASLELILEGALAAYAVALVDAMRGGDRAGAKAAVDAMGKAVDHTDRPSTRSNVRNARRRRDDEQQEDETRENEEPRRLQELERPVRSRTGTRPGSCGSRSSTARSRTRRAHAPTSSRVWRRASAFLRARSRSPRSPRAGTRPRRPGCASGPVATIERRSTLSFCRGSACCLAAVDADAIAKLIRDLEREGLHAVDPSARGVRSDRRRS